ncbi:hypothetical protein E4T49_04680 [Aureobasidium sp. EXF-10728]|nr:hypothetical protein E4T49_04680 [Aureobasidium sp. EXF-10728]
MAARYAVSLMALLGAVSAQSSSYNSYTNSSSIASATSSSASPQYTDGSVVTVAGVQYLIQDDTSYQGTVLNLARKRQADSSIQSCLNVCSADVECKGTAYVSDTGNCIYYSSVDLDTKADAPGTDFALVQKRISASSTSSVFNGTQSATSVGAGATRTPGQSGNSTASATRSASRSAGVTGGAGNSTSLRPTGSASATSSGAVSTPVPSSPSTIITINGVVFLLEIDISYTGVKINFAIILAKRAGNSLDDCLVTCADNASCAGTAFDEASGTCTFYSSIDDASRAVDTGNDFATVISRAGANNGGATNGTSGNSTTPAAPSNVTAESFICPRLNGGVLLSNVEVTFSISCSEFLIGTTYDALAEIRQKRQAIDNTLPSTLSNCVDLCSLAPSCVGTTFEIATEQCSFYSAVSYATPLDGFDSAVRVQDNSGNGGTASTVTTTATVSGAIVTVTLVGQTTTAYVAGPTSTATVYAIVTSTVYANGGATGLPSGAVVTTAIPTSTVTYVNPVSTITMPQNYGQSTVTVTVNGNGAAAATQTVYQTVDQNGNVIGSSTAGAVAGGAGNPGAAYPTVTVYSSYCPQATQGSVVWTTVYVR